MKRFVIKLKHYKERLCNFFKFTKKKKKLPVAQKKYTATILFPSKEMMENAMKYVK